MKKILTVMLLITLCFCLAGCDSWMSGSYVSVTPHLQQDAAYVNTDTEVSNYYQLQKRMSAMAAIGRENDIIYFRETDSSRIKAEMTAAVNYLKTKDPIGAYAIDEISFEVGTNGGRMAAAVSITYIHGRSEILQIRHVANMSTAKALITGALENCDAALVLRVDAYEALDITQLVQDYVDAHPDTCMEMPKVSATVYPEEGVDRVIELRFTYQTSRESLRQMQQAVQTVFSSVELYVSGFPEAEQKYFQLYLLLMERRTNYVIETSITPSYSLLQHGVGDSKAFATIYAAMCRRAGLECYVVSGTRSGEAYYWNVIVSEGVLQHVDLLRCNQDGRFITKTADEMNGYVWDYSQFQMTGDSGAE